MVSLKSRLACDEPFGPEPFGREPFGCELKAEWLGVERLTAEGLSRVEAAPTYSSSNCGIPL